MDKNMVAKELLAVARELTAGDEWADAETAKFVKELAQEMNRDSGFVEGAKAQGNKVKFVNVQQGGIFGPNYVPLVILVTEFGYPPHSESLNGTMYSEHVRAFRIPGGTTKNRDPKEFWKSAKDSLQDIIRRAT